VNVTATLFAQVITFAVLVWFLNRFLWGPLTQMMADRNKRIADGLAAAERGQHERELAEQRAREILKEAKQQASQFISQAQKRATEIVEEAKDQARDEGSRMLVAARAELEQEVSRAKDDMRGRVVQLALAGAEKVLEREIDAAQHDRLLKTLAAEL
jgi:F-type H+-transporting ATPase subunit b